VQIRAERRPVTRNTRHARQYACLRNQIALRCAFIDVRPGRVIEPLSIIQQTAAKQQSYILQKGK
jgi:hypothetical protein